MELSRWQKAFDKFHSIFRVLFFSGRIIFYFFKSENMIFCNACATFLGELCDNNYIKLKIESSKELL